MESFREGGREGEEEQRMKRERQNAASVLQLSDKKAPTEWEEKRMW